MQNFISIAGNVGSGKTTMAKLIAQKLNWTYLPYDKPEGTYLDDLFKNPSRWSFESQITFLSSKANNIRFATNGTDSVVLDRSIYEDIDIFVTYFYNKGYLDERAFETYHRVAEIIIESLPHPDFIIYCNCRPQLSHKRIQSRNLRDFEKNYPTDYIYRVYNLYEEWKNKFNLTPTFEINTETHNVLEKEIWKLILQDIDTIYSMAPGSDQLSLFDYIETPSNKKSLRLLTKINDIPIIKNALLIKPSSKIKLYRKTVYIAAPFTGFSVSNNNEKENILFDIQRPHGIIESGPYKDGLLAISKAFEKLGYRAILPHRDVNEWGKKVLEPQTVVQMCTNAIQNSDLFFGIFGGSLGVHFEAGLAVALKKPIIVATVKDIENSFFASGIEKLPFSYAFTADNFSDLVKQLATKEIKIFLEKHIP